MTDPVKKRQSGARSRSSSAARQKTDPPLDMKVYDELRRLARHYFRKERGNHTLQPTALVHEAYLRLGGQDLPTSDRVHFMALCAKVMRQVLVDHARGRQRERRGGKMHRVEIDSRLSPADCCEFEMLAMHELMEKLAQLDPRQAQVVEMRFFGGLNVEEVAQA